MKTDFGSGFYTTTLERQARAWAWHIRSRRGGVPAVVYADLDRNALSALEWLSFVRGDYGADDFWSFVTHCRLGGTDHARSLPENMRYDAVFGPVTARWEQRALMADTDQMSFHTPRAEAVLNAATWRILR